MTKRTEKEARETMELFTKGFGVPDAGCSDMDIQIERNADILGERKRLVAGRHAIEHVEGTTFRLFTAPEIGEANHTFEHFIDHGRPTDTQEFGVDGAPDFETASKSFFLTLVFNEDEFRTTSAGTGDIV